MQNMQLSGMEAKVLGILCTIKEVVTSKTNQAAAITTIIIMV